MKRFSILFALVLVTLAQGTAQPNSGVEFTVSSGYVIPASPMTFSNYWKMQYGGGIGAGVPLSESVVLFGAVEYYKFALNTRGINNSFNTQYMRDIWAFNDVSLTPTADPSSVTTVSANMRIAPSGFSGSLSPYFTAGAGVMNFSLKEISLPTTSIISINGSDISMTAQQSITGGNETSAFFQFGLGMDVRMTSRVNVFAEARYVHGISKGLGTSYAPLTAGIKFRL